MDKRKIIVIMIIAVLVSSIISGYLFDTLTHNIGITLRLPSLEHSPSMEYEVKQTIATMTTTTVFGGETQTSRVERKITESLQEYLTAYSEQGRLISYTASVSLLVPRNEVKSSVDKVLFIINIYNGYISSMNIGEEKAYLVAKIPQDNLFNFLEDASKIGEVVSKSISGVDLTDKIIDLRARIRNAEAIEAHLLGLLNKTGNVSEILEVMRELSVVREEIEVMKAQLRNLEISISYSTVTIEISEKELKKEYVELLFKVVDSGGLLVPNTYIYVKDGEARMFVTDEFGEVKVPFEKNTNVTLIAVFYRSDGEVLKTSQTDVADSNKTVTIRFSKPSEPPYINLEKSSMIASFFINFLITGLIITTVLVMPMLFIFTALIALARRAYSRMKLIKTVK
ncbi:MAG: DUF4349 domain-containing protein [Thaumarchaeota archaeon]|jgi:hypothetical protein|nr:DUF4349 domain-containing protein [Candidatus Geocrenenecus arthurdayi]